MDKVLQDVARERFRVRDSFALRDLHVPSPSQPKVWFAVRPSLSSPASWADQIIPSHHFGVSECGTYKTVKGHRKFNVRPRELKKAFSFICRRRAAYLRLIDLCITQL